MSDGRRPELSAVHERRRFPHGGLEREYLLYVPPGLGRGAPLVVMLHGGGATAEYAAFSTGWSAVAKRDGCAVVYPEATRRDPAQPASFLRNPAFWNVGGGFGHAEQRGVDDVGFVRTLIDALLDELGCDPARVLVSGFSNGASLAFCLAARHSERIAAIGPVAGKLWNPDEPPVRPVSLIYITGEEDPLNPIAGGRVESPWGGGHDQPPVMATIRTWADWLGCPPMALSDEEHDGVRRVVLGPGRRGSRVELLTIAGAGHVWPGGPRVLSETITGAGTDKLDATDAIWRFFSGLS